MTEIEDIILNIEKTFYEKFPDLLETWVSCNGQKRLPCNCLTGLGMNFWGYAAKNCWQINIENSFQIRNNLPYILSTYDDVKVAPIFSDDIGKDKYYLCEKVCDKQEVMKDKVYMRENAAGSFKELEGKIAQINLKNDERITESETTVEFLKQLIVAVRTLPSEKEGKVLFAAMMFFFPNKTMKLVCDYLEGQDCTNDQKKYIKQFMDQYDCFLCNLKERQYGFLSEFSKQFGELTGVYVGEWIGEAVRQKDKDLTPKFYLETLLAAYGRNITEKGRRTSKYKKIRALVANA